MDLAEQSLRALYGSPFHEVDVPDTPVKLMVFKCPNGCPGCVKPLFLFMVCRSVSELQGSHATLGDTQEMIEKILEAALTPEYQYRIRTMREMEKADWN